MDLFSRLGVIVVIIFKFMASLYISAIQEQTVSRTHSIIIIPHRSCIKAQKKRKSHLHEIPREMQAPVPTRKDKPKHVESCHSECFVGNVTPVDGHRRLSLVVMIIVSHHRYPGEHASSTSQSHEEWYKESCTCPRGCISRRQTPHTRTCVRSQIPHWRRLVPYVQSK